VQFNDLSPLALAILENIGVESKILRMDFEKKVISSYDENTFLECLMIHIESIIHDPHKILDTISNESSIDQSYLISFLKQTKSGIQQILSIPVPMRFWIKKEDTD
jgi:hypothetical protein